MGEQHHAGRGWLPELMVLVMVGLAFVALQLDLGGRWFGWHPIDPDRDPAKVLPPVGLHLAAQGTAPRVAPAASGGALDPAKVAAALSSYVGDKRLGPHVGVLVAQADGKVVYRHGAGTVTPASTTKLLTSTAALASLGPMTTFQTSVKRVGDTRQIVLVGGGDPFLMSTPARAKGLYPARSDITTLARRAAAELRTAQVTRVRLGYDASLFSGPAVNPAWPPDYIPDGVVPPITSLWVDEGHQPGGTGYVADPARAAADQFRAALVAAGIRVPAAPAPRKAPASSTDIASVSSAPLGQLVQRTLGVSDNNAAEVLARHVGIAKRHEGSFAASSQAVVDVLRSLGVSTTPDQLYDGSGLSRRDVLSTQTLVDVLRAAASPEHPELRQVITGLPVAGFTGSLQYRFDDAPPAGRGRVRAKTGTLTGVHGLAGVATDVQGNLMVFVAIADRVSLPNTLPARQTIDDLAGALGACSCGGPPAGT